MKANRKASGFAVVYLRYSPRPDKLQGDGSLQYQADSCERYCHGEGYVLRCPPFADPDTSGSKEDERERPGLWGAIKSVRNGDALVVDRLDRIARSVLLSEYVRREVEKRGGRIEAVNGDSNLQTPEAVMLRQILAAVAEYQRKLTAARTSDAKRHQLRSGVSCCNDPPFGMRIARVEKCLDGRGREVRRRIMEPDPKEQRILKYVRDLRTSGAKPSTIAEALNAKGWTNRAGTPWDRRSVNKIWRRLDLIAQHGV